MRAVRLQDLHGLVPPGLVEHGYVDDAVPVLELILVVPKLLAFRVHAFHRADQPRDPAPIAADVDALHTAAAAERLHGAVGHTGLVEFLYRLLSFMRVIDDTEHPVGQAEHTRPSREGSPTTAVF